LHKAKSTFFLIRIKARPILSMKIYRRGIDSERSANLVMSNLNTKTAIKIRETTNITIPT